MATYGTFVDGVSLKAVEANDFLTWTTFTPVLKQSGNLSFSTRTCRYAKVNKFVIASYYFVISSSGTTGVEIIGDLPVNAVSTSIEACGIGRIFDTSITTNYQPIPVINTTSTFSFISSLSTSLTDYVGKTGVLPIQLASGDEVAAILFYEAA